jgi:hypothetical protein
MAGVFQNIDVRHSSVLYVCKNIVGQKLGIKTKTTTFIIVFVLSFMFFPTDGGQVTVLISADYSVKNTFLKHGKENTKILLLFSRNLPIKKFKQSRNEYNLILVRCPIQSL